MNNIQNELCKKSACYIAPCTVPLLLKIILLLKDIVV